MASKLSLDAIFLLPGLAARSRSDRAVEGALDDLQLLLPGQAAEIHRIAGHPDGQAGVLLGMLHGVDEGLTPEDVHVQMVGPLAEVAVQNGDQVALRCASSLPRASGTMEKVLETPS